MSLKANPPAKQECVLQAEMPWESYRLGPNATILEVDGRCRMWYGALPHAGTGWPLSRVCCSAAAAQRGLLCCAQPAATLACRPLAWNHDIEEDGHMRMSRDTNAVGRARRAATRLSRYLLFGQILCGSSLAADEPPMALLGSFEDAVELANWSSGDAGDVVLSIEPRVPTDTNRMLKVVMLGGRWPGITISPPADWSPYEVLSFVVWSSNPLGLGLRVDDVHSTSFNTRWNHDITLEKGRNFVQIPITRIAASVDVTRIRSLILFTGSPPPGLTLWFDDVRLGPEVADHVPFIPYAERADYIPSLAVETPHFPFGRGLAGGPVKSLVVTGVAAGRETVELMQRLDMEVSLVSWDRSFDANSWGLGDHYTTRGNRNDWTTVQRYVASTAQGPEQFDAMLVHAPMGFDRFTPGTMAALMDRVKSRGEGLVLVFPFPGQDDGPWPDELRSLSPLVDSRSDTKTDDGWMRAAGEGRRRGQRWRTTRDHAVTRGVPLEALPFEFMEAQAYDVAPGAQVLIETEEGDPILAVMRLGKGRVAAFAVRAHGLTPQFDIPADREHARDYRYWEAWYSLLARTALWTAGRELRRQGEPEPMKLVEYADPALQVRQWRDGAGEVTDWELRYVPLPAVRKLALHAPLFVPGEEEFSVTVDVPPGISEATYSLTLAERLGTRRRIMERLTLTPAPGQAGEASLQATLDTRRIRRRVMEVTVRAHREDRLIAAGAAPIVITREPAWEEYEIFTWLGYGLPFLRDFEEERMRQFGLTANLVGQGNTGNMMRQLRAGFGIHAYGFADGLHLRDFDRYVRQYQITGDSRWLVRSPSFSDPRFLEQEQAAVRERAARVAPFAPLSTILADETSLTSYTQPHDFDHHPSNVAAFRRRMEEKFGTVAGLQAATGAAAASFATLWPPTTAASRRDGNWGLWNEWRAHNDAQWAQVFEFYRRQIRQAYPAARLSVSGTQPAAVFNGIDWARMIPSFDAMGDYTSRFQLRKRLSFAHRQVRSTPWVGYGRSGRAVEYQLWSNLSFDGDGAAIFWWYSLRNPDLTYSRSGQDYQRVFEELRAGIGRQYQQATRQWSPVAILWSPASQRAAWTQGRAGDFAQTEAAVVQSLVAAGYDPFFITGREVAGGGVDAAGAKAIVLPMTLSLGLGEKAGGLKLVPALRAFEAAGGLVLATEEAQFDEFLQPLGPAREGAAFPAYPADLDQLQAALEGHGAVPYVTLRTPAGQRIPATSAVLHRLHGEQLAGYLLMVLREPVGRREEVGADGVIYLVADPAGGPRSQPCVIDLSSFDGFVFYDLRSGERLDLSGGKLRLDLRAGEGRPIAILPYAVTSVDVAVRRQDRALQVNWHLRRDAGDTILPHVLRIDVIDAGTGQVDPALGTKVVAGPDPAGVVEIPLSLDEATRDWQVDVTDILTGTLRSVEDRAAR